MQALPIANIATVSQAPPSAAGAPLAAATDNSADPGTLPPFAQIVREILVRTTTQDAIQPAHTSRSSVMSAAAPANSQLPTASHGTSPRSLPQLIDPATLNLAALLNQPIPVQQPLPSPPAASPTETPTTPKPCDAKTSSVSQVGSDPQLGSSCPTNVAPAGTTTPQSVATQGTLPLSLPTLEIQLLDSQCSSVLNSSVPNSSVPNSPVLNPSITFSSSCAANVVVNVQPQPQTNENDQPVNPIALPKKPIDLEVFANTPSAFAGIPISSLDPQLATLQPTASANIYMTVHGPSAVPHAPAAQSNPKTTLDPTPPVTSLPAPETTPLLPPKNAPLVHAETQPAAPPTNASSMNQSASQDNSSNNLDAQKSAGPSTTSSTNNAHDTINFAQALANASNTSSKPDAVPAVTNQQPAVLPVSAPSDERLTQPATAPLAATPQANPPQTVFRSLDTAAAPTISDAQVSQSSERSEMRIAMQTDKFGAIELHTRVAGDEIGAAITVEKRDAHAALAMELPALQQALSEKQLRVDQITLLHGPLHSTTGDASGQQQSQRQQGDRRTPSEPSLPSFVPDSGSAFLFSQSATESSGIFDSRGRLSVQA